MRYVKRFLLATLLVAIVFVAGTVITTGLQFVYSLEFGIPVTGVVVSGALFVVCWFVAGEVLA